MNLLCVVLVKEVLAQTGKHHPDKLNQRRPSHCNWKGYSVKLTLSTHPVTNFKMLWQSQGLERSFTSTLRRNFLQIAIFQKNMNMNECNISGGKFVTGKFPMYMYKHMLNGHVFYQKVNDMQQTVNNREHTRCAYVYLISYATCRLATPCYRLTSLLRAEAQYDCNQQNDSSSDCMVAEQPILLRVSWLFFATANSLSFQMRQTSFHLHDNFEISNQTPPTLDADVPQFR